MYVHKWSNDTEVHFSPGKVVCVGRNYADHIAEMQSEISRIPLLFMKPTASMVDMSQPLAIPTEHGECHNELEIALLIGSSLAKGTTSDADRAIIGVGLGLDLTLRDVQARLKADGQPWERAKAFDGSCPLSAFIPRTDISSLSSLAFSLSINNVIRQSGNSSMMLTDPVSLVCQMSHAFTLQPGDVVMTGTPKGVGPLHVNDRVSMSFNDMLHLNTHVIRG